MRSILLACFLFVCACRVGYAQIPASFQVPIVGYLFDGEAGSIRPVVGIPGNSRIEAPLQLGIRLDRALVLPDQRHAIVSSSAAREALLLDLDTARFRNIAGAPAAIKAMRGSADGSKAALYYDGDKLLLLDGLPGMPAVRATVDLSLTAGRLNRFAISDDGVLLLSFSSDGEDSLYLWTPSMPLNLLATASHVSDIQFSGKDAIVVDSGTNRALLIPNVLKPSAPILIANADDGVSEPVAIAISKRGEIYVANAGTGVLLVFDLAGRIVRHVRCGCAVTAMIPLRSGVFRLTDRLDRPVIVLDSESSSEQIQFIPALSDRNTVETGR